MAYNVSEINALYARSVELYDITPLGEITAVEYVEYSDEYSALVYQVSNSTNSVLVYIIADPESGEFLATCDV